MHEPLLDPILAMLERLPAVTIDLAQESSTHASLHAVNSDGGVVGHQMLAGLGWVLACLFLPKFQLRELAS